MTHRISLALLTVAIFLQGVSPAEAQWSRQHGMTCRAVSVPEQPWYEIHDRGVTNVDDDHLLNLMCPSFDTDAHPDSGVPKVRVYVYDGNSIFGISVRACRTFRNSLGAVCGPSVGTAAGFTGDAVLTLDEPKLDEWDQTSFGYLHIVLPPNGYEPGPFGGGGLSYIKGWVTGE